MGLDCDFNAWNGSYSAFNRFRQFVAAASGASYPPHSEKIMAEYPIIRDGERDSGVHTQWWVLDDAKPFDPGVRLFLSHSDCDGEISWQDCIRVARGLLRIRPEAERLAADPEWEAVGRIAANGGYLACLDAFVAGCRAAMRAQKPLRFH